MFSCKFNSVIVCFFLKKNVLSLQRLHCLRRTQGGRGGWGKQLDPPESFGGGQARVRGVYFRVIRVRGSLSLVGRNWSSSRQ